MADCGFADLSCFAANAATSAFDGIARSAGEAAGQVIAESFTFWINTDTINPDNEAVRNLQQLTLPIAAAMLVGSILVQAIRMVVSAKKDPAINIALGLVRYAVVSTIGLSLLAMFVQAGDQLSRFLVDQGVGSFAQRISALMTGDVITNSFLLLIIALIGLILGAIQWLLAFVRQAGILVLAVMLVLAASGSINDSTKVWLNRLIPWILALVLYKPIAAMIYTIGFTLFGEGQDFTTVMTGLMVMALAAVAMPAMMRFFSWSQLTATGGAGAGSVLAAGATGAGSVAAMRSARSMELTGPGSGSTGSPGGARGGAGAGARGTPPGGDGGQGPGPGSSTTPSGAAGAPTGGSPAARAGGGVPAKPPAGGSSAAAGSAAAAGAAGAGAAVAQGAIRAGQAAVDGVTQSEGQQQ